MSGLVAADPPLGSALDAAVEHIQALVLDEFEPGDRLPAEADLAARLELSRLTIREALKVLSGRGLVELSKGRRAVVRDRDSRVLSGYLAMALRRDPRGLLELNEIRQSLEVLSASAAAQHSSRAAREAIGVALTAMESAAGKALAHGELDQVALEEYHRADLRFHGALALASGNRMLGFILESLSDCLHESFVTSARGHFARGGTFEEVVLAHRAIAEAVNRGDAAGAGRAMRRHLDEAAKDLKSAMTYPHAPGGPAAGARSDGKRS